MQPLLLWRGLLSVVCLLMTIRLGSAQWGQPEVHVIEPLASGLINWTDNLVRSQDRAEVPRGGAQKGQRQATLQTATQGARQRLFTLLEQIRLDSSKTVGAALQNLPEGQQRVQHLVKDAQVVETLYSAAGEVASSVQVPLTGPLLAVLFPRSAHVMSDAAPQASTAHTGIVIDARGLGIQPALLPRIVDESGQAVYDPTMVDPDVAIQRGYIAYARTHADAAVKTRIGDQPLVLRARRVLGTSRVDVVLPGGAAAQIRDYAGTQALLKRCQILIVM
jgi:hypothetical protein